MAINEKHLEFLQNNISRMNQCSFQMKGWAITIVSALLAMFASTIDKVTPGNKMFIFVAIAPTILFWILDSLYLSNERKLIAIYNDAAEITDIPKRIKVKNYEIPLKKYKGWQYSLIKAMLSPSELALYGLIIIGLALFGSFYK
ncbi:membrane protein of unknown function [Ruminococcaceae bacterium BL-4]|nr:membrane protein of unknown function [Ruminococcaceae bacterium BL-4]